MTWTNEEYIWSTPEQEEVERNTQDLELPTITRPFQHNGHVYPRQLLEDEIPENTREGFVVWNDEDRRMEIESPYEPIRFENITVSSHNHMFRGDFTMEHAEDVTSLHGFDTERVLTNDLADEIRTEIDSEILTSIDRLMGKVVVRFQYEQPEMKDLVPEELFRID